MMRSGPQSYRDWPTQQKHPTSSFLGILANVRMTSENRDGFSHRISILWFGSSTFGMIVLRGFNHDIRQ